uniref:Uncharacterized protein n=1 Tax=Anguilla anguilla TaxID=7936 RepID=A0A0E9V7G6_ANGAN
MVFINTGWCLFIIMTVVRLDILLLCGGLKPLSG